MDISDINRINYSPYKVFLAITGGGQTFIGDYMKVSGASKTIVGAIIPYSQILFDKFLGVKQNQYCNEEAARKLARRSFIECISVGVDKEYAIGIGVTCSLVKEDERPGRQHKIFVSAHTKNITLVDSLILEQGRTRESEEGLAEEVIFNLLKFITGTGEQRVFILKGYEDYKRNSFSKTENIETKNNTFLVYSGNFCPFHEGHKQIAELSQKIIGVPVTLELSVNNADKGLMDYIDLKNRVKYLKYDYIITDAPTFKDKVNAIRSQCDKPIVFTIGVDTWERVLQEKYAGPIPELIKFFKDNDVKFLIFGRNGKVPIGHEEIRIINKESDNFRLDISSTEIRNKNEK